MARLVSAYVTASDAREAERIAKALLQARLAACVSIVPGAKSLFRWRGKLARANETVLIAKTKFSLRQAFARKVKELHSYDQPCIVFWPIIDGDQGYLDWVAAETK